MNIAEAYRKHSVEHKVHRHNIVVLHSVTRRREGVYPARGKSFSFRHRIIMPEKEPEAADGVGDKEQLKEDEQQAREGIELNGADKIRDLK